MNGLDARQWISAGYACHLYGGKVPAYIKPVYEQREDVSAPVKDISNGTGVGFRYLQFGCNPPETLTVRMTAQKPVKVTVRLDARDGKEIAAFKAQEGKTEYTVPVKEAGIGKHAVYFLFEAEDDGPAAELDRFTFD